MAYRDPIDAARMRAERLRDEVGLRAERIAVELIPQLPVELGERLERLEQRATAVADDLEGWAQIEDDLVAFGEVVDEVIRLAPQIDQRFNRLPDAFPRREQAPGLPLFDIYDVRVTRAREGLHRAIMALDDQAELYDARPGYFDQMERPFLVEAAFRAEGHPLLFQVAVPQQQNEIGWRTQPVRGMRLALRARVRPSTPQLRLHVSWLHSLRALLRLAQRTTSGDERIDSRLAIDALEADARRAFTPELRQAVVDLLEQTARPVLTVADGHARLDWGQDQAKGAALTAAVGVMVALRQLKPIALLRRRQAES